METNDDVGKAPNEKCLNTNCLQTEEYFEEHRQYLEKEIVKIKLEHEKEIDKMKSVWWDNVFEIRKKDSKIEELQLENEELKIINNQLENAINENSGGSVDHGKSGGSQGSRQNDNQTNETVKEQYEEMNKSGSSMNQCENAKTCAEEKAKTDDMDDSEVDEESGEFTSDESSESNDEGSDDPDYDPKGQLISECLFDVLNFPKN